LRAVMHWVKGAHFSSNIAVNFVARRYTTSLAIDHSAFFVISAILQVAQGVNRSTGIITIFIALMIIAIIVVAIIALTIEFN